MRLLILPKTILGAVLKTRMLGQLVECRGVRLANGILRQFFICFLLLLMGLAYQEENFKFHLNSEPKSLDPAEVSLGNGVGYFYENIYQGLYVYKKKGLEPIGAKVCNFQKLSLDCELNPNFKWSDGKVVEASEYVLAFRHLLAFKSKSSVLRILKNIKNASEVFSGNAKDTQLGVVAVNPHRLQFKFQNEDPDFLYKLASPLVAPIRNERFPKTENAKELLVTGPYKIENWIVGKRIFLTENSYYPFSKSGKPKVEIFFIDDDQTALNLYEDKKINFLKTLPTILIPEFNGRADFVQVPMARFDYIGFSPELKNFPELRAALALSLDFNELKKMFSALGTPGCSGLPDDYMGGQVCVQYDLAEAKKAFEKLPAKIKEKRFKLAFSNYNSADALREMQWVAEQWKKHLGIQVDIEKLESGVFNERLKTKAPDIFRKSAIIDRPTCLAAVENFGAQGSESFLQIDSERLERTLKKMNESKSPAGLKNLCSEALRELISSYNLIGLGRIHFTMLVSPQFRGWELNELNGLDLSQLQSQTAGALKNKPEK